MLLITSIKFDLSGLVQGIGNAESLDGAASVVSLQLGSLLFLSRPDNSVLLGTKPLFSRTFKLTGFDGAIDFAGTSGASTGVVSASASNSFVSINASDFSMFSGAGGGNINLGLNATGASFATGAGNLVTQFSTAAMGSAFVTYTYAATNEVPEPASLAMVVAGLGLLAARRRASKQG